MRNTLKVAFNKQFKLTAGSAVYPVYTVPYSAANRQKLNECLASSHEDYILAVRKYIKEILCNFVDKNRFKGS